MNINYEAPSVKILLTTVDGDDYELLSSELAGDLLSLHTTKFMKNPAGSWNMKLVNRSNLQMVLKSFKTAPNQNVAITPYDIFKPMGLIDIYINDKEVMLGIIDDIRRSTMMSDDGKPQIAYTISGRDLGSFLIEQKIWYEQNPAALKDRDNFSLTKGYKFLEKIKSKLGHEIIADIYKIWFSDVLNKTVKDLTTGKTVGAFKFSDGKRMDQKLLCSYSSTGGVSTQNYLNAYPTTFEAWNNEGAIWNFLDTFATKPLNELYIDTGGCDIRLNNKEQIKILPEGQAQVIFRPSPFDDSKTGIFGNAVSHLSIHDLPTNNIFEEDVTECNLGFGRNNIPSIYRVYPMTGLIPISSSGIFVNPLYDEVALKRYGHKPFILNVDAFDPSSTSAGNNFSKMSEEFQTKLYNWHRNNDKYLTGSFVIKGNEKIRIGQKLNYGLDENDVQYPVNEPYERGYYYTVGVEQNYEYGSSFKTTVHVDRGVSLKRLEDFKS